MKQLIIPFLAALPFLASSQANNEGVLKPVQHQLEAYNNRNIEAFLEAYSDTVKVFQFPDKLMYQGKNIMRRNYAGMFATRPDLHAEIVNRMVLGNTVIDQESVTFDKSSPKLNAIAIYKVHNGIITEVYFIQ